MGKVRDRINPALQSRSGPGAPPAGGPPSPLPSFTCFPDSLAKPLIILTRWATQRTLPNHGADGEPPTAASGGSLRVYPRRGRRNSSRSQRKIKMVAAQLSWNTQFPRTAPRCSDAPLKEPESSTLNTRSTSTTRSRPCALPANVSPAAIPHLQEAVQLLVHECSSSQAAQNPSSSPLPSLF